MRRRKRWSYGPCGSFSGKRRTKTKTSLRWNLTLMIYSPPCSHSSIASHQQTVQAPLERQMSADTQISTELQVSKGTKVNSSKDSETIGSVHETTVSCLHSMEGHTRYLLSFFSDTTFLKFENISTSSNFCCENDLPVLGKITKVYFMLLMLSTRHTSVSP